MTAYEYFSDTTKKMNKEENQKACLPKEHTCGTKEEQDHDPIYPEENEGKESPKWLED